MRIIYLFLILIAFTSSCRKELKEETIVNIHCVTPHNGEGVAGCRVTIYEVKEKRDFNVLGDPEWEVINKYSCISGENGNATMRFHYMRKAKYQYILKYDFSALEQPLGMNEVEIVLPFGWANYMDKNKFKYDFTFNVIGKCGVHFKFENVNCSGPSDEMRYTAYNLSENYNESPFFGPSVYYGCGTFLEHTTANNQFTTGKWVYKTWVTRGGETHIQYDTFNLQPGVMNEMFIEY